MYLGFQKPLIKSKEIHFLDADVEQAWRYCIRELAQIMSFRYVVLVQLIETSEITYMPIRFAWNEDTFVEPFAEALQQTIWLQWMKETQCKICLHSQLPCLEFQQDLDWQVQSLALIPLHSLSGKALGGLLLLHDQDVSSQQEFLYLEEPLLRYAALLLEQTSFKYKQWLPLNTLQSELNALQVNALSASKKAPILQRLQDSLDTLSGLASKAFDSTLCMPLVEKQYFSLRHLLERFITEQTHTEKMQLRLNFNVDIPLFLEGDERLVRQLLLNLLLQIYDFYPNVRDFNLYVLMLDNHYPETHLKISICPASGSRLKPTDLSESLVSVLYRRAEVVALLCKTMQGHSNFLFNQGLDALWFTLRLKYRVLANDAVQQETAALLVDNKAEQVQDLKPFHILVAEDSPINQTVIHKMLNRLGYSCELVDNGLKVLDAWEKGNYQLILMDCEMPELDGYDTAAEIRKREQAQGGHIPIIALTAHALAEHRERSRTVGMDEHLSKPISLPVLKDTLEYWEQQCLNMEASAPDDYCGDTTDVAKGMTVDSVMVEKKAIETIDYKTLEDLKKVLGDKFSIILEQFLLYAPQQFKLLQEAHTQQDSEGVRSKAHQFKGEAAQIGALELSSLCKELEMLACSGNIRTAAELLEHIDVEVQKVVVSLNKELKTG